MVELIGHFHPLLVHLPIGILLVALILKWLLKKEKYKLLKPVIAVILLWGTITALLSCLTGYFLSISDDYDQSIVNWHMWMAIGVLLTSAILYTKEKNPKVEVSEKLLSLGLLGLLMVTGHLGSSLTHGSDYLTKPFLKLFKNDSITTSSATPLLIMQKAFAYKDAVPPISKTKHYFCPNINKQNDRLKMDTAFLLMKGKKYEK